MTPRVRAVASPLLADRLAASLSPNAAAHLREASVFCDPALATPPEALRSRLMQGGFPVPEAVLDLEARAGGSFLPHSRTVGTGAILRQCPWIRLKDLPLFAGEPLLPVVADTGPLTDDWDGPALVMGASGALHVYEAPFGPFPAFDSLEHFLELEALAPMKSDLHVLRVDARCGETVAGLAGAVPHPPASGEGTKGFVGNDAWVKELRVGEATFLLTERLDLVVEVAAILLDGGFTLGHRGPVAEGDPNGEKTLTFVDLHPNLGTLANEEVTIWGKPGSYAVTRRPVREGGVR